MSKKKVNMDQIDDLIPSTKNSNSIYSKTSHSSTTSIENDWVHVTLNNGIKKEWVDDSKVVNCKKCNIVFNFWGPRRHHCRNCGHVFCFNCCKLRYVAVSDSLKRPQISTFSGNIFKCLKAL